jgi:hypothetical protein
MSVQLFNGTVPGAFAPSQWLLLDSEQLTLTWQLVTTGGPTVVLFFLEFTSDPTQGANTVAAREVDEQDTGNGVVLMAKVTRQFDENNASTGLADGTHVLSTQFVRQAPFVRVQMEVTAGAATLLLTAASGSLVVST